MRLISFNKHEVEELASGPILEEIYIRHRLGREYGIGDVLRSMFEAYDDSSQEGFPESGTIAVRRKRFLRLCDQDDAFRKYKVADEQLKHAFDGKLLYLPTYRRIEEEFEAIMHAPSDYPDPRRAKTVPSFESEMIKFGMEDVEAAIQSKENEIRFFSQRAQNDLTLRYLKRILSHEYETVGTSYLATLDENAIKAVLDRIDEDILSNQEKRQVFEIVSHASTPDADVSSFDAAEKIICHYFSLLSEFDKNLDEQEQCFATFCNICNAYLVNNRIEYDEQSYTCKVVNLWGASKHVERDSAPNTREIALSDLSSGEKQIVALFSRLNLQSNGPMFVFIDEPELSLSIDWQRRFLADIVNSINCSGLFATTHSPFVFDNDLVSSVHGINEFLR